MTSIGSTAVKKTAAAPCAISSRRRAGLLANVGEPRPDALAQVARFWLGLRQRSGGEQDPSARVEGGRVQQQCGRHAEPGYDDARRSRAQGRRRR